jgi:pantothenate kinase
MKVNTKQTCLRRQRTKVRKGLEQTFDKRELVIMIQQDGEYC